MPKDAAATAPSSRHERGPVTVTATLDQGQVPVGERLTLRIEAQAPDGVRITMPQIEETIGPFAVRDRRMPPDIPDGATRRWTHSFTLDTFAAGAHEIPPLTIRFEDSRADAVGPDGEPIMGEIVTDPLPITIVSVLAEDVAETDFRDIKAAVEVPVERPGIARSLLIGGVVGLVAAAIIVAFVLIRRRRAADAEASAPPVPPHVWARAQLAALEAEDLVGSGRFQEFYLRLSDIVRNYVERRFGLMAPERTTEEFLREAERGDVLSVGHRELLRSFLRAADLVKFARHEPAASEANDALDGARAFVDQTEQAPWPAGIGDEAAQAPEAAA